MTGTIPAADTEAELAGLGCLDQNNYCRIERVCVLRGAQRRRCVPAVLDGDPLADLIKPQKALSNLLGLDRRPAVRAA